MPRRQQQPVLQMPAALQRDEHSQPGDALQRASNENVRPAARNGVQFQSLPNLYYLQAAVVLKV